MKPTFLRSPTRADLRIAPPPRPLPEPRYFNPELERRDSNGYTRADLLIYAISAALMGFVLGYYLAS